MVYISECLHSRVVARSSVAGCEYIFVDIDVNGSAFFLSCIYLPPRVTTMAINTLMNEFRLFSDKYSDIVLMGDFNINFLSNDSLLQYLEDRLEFHNLCVVNNSTPTHHTNNSSSLLDLMVIFKFNSHKVIDFGQFHIPGISHHDLIYLSYKTDNLNLPGFQTITFRDFGQVDERALFADAYCRPWESIYGLLEVDDQLKAFNRMLSDLYNEHVPVKTIKRKVVKNPWYNAEVEKAAYFRDYYHKIWIKSRTEDNWKMFTYRRNKASTIRR